MYQTNKHNLTGALPPFAKVAFISVLNALLLLLPLAAYAGLWSKHDESASVKNTGQTMINSQRMTGMHKKGCHLCDLRYENFSRQQLAGTDWTGSFLFGSSFAWSDLKGANFKSAILTTARMEWANFDHASFNKANLEEAAMFRSTFRGANLRRANMAYADLSTSVLEGANLLTANLHEARLTGVQAKEVNMRNADLREADLTDADLRHSDFQGASLWKAKLSGANLKNASFVTAHMRHVDISQTFIRQTNFRSAKLQGANFSGSSLHTVNFHGADLSSANFRGAHFKNVILINANLCGAILPNGTKAPCTKGTHHRSLDLTPNETMGPHNSAYREPQVAPYKEQPAGSLSNQRRSHLWVNTAPQPKANQTAGTHTTKGPSTHPLHSNSLPGLELLVGTSHDVLEHSVPLPDVDPHTLTPHNKLLGNTAPANPLHNHAQKPPPPSQPMSFPVIQEQEI
ncbi:pentapeptide repeat-containing protein [Magnetococcus sp. PR-3]|uniref:pentapeptide repeat-containing protein n=1 Tax=Magnetococcus sp. PR-3 TaxID=3120355 RepID=UPI002FCE66DE